MKVFHELLQKSRKKVIGLMSGTSVDGVDAALVEIQEQGLSTQVELIAFKTFPFESEIRTRIFDLFHPDSARVDEICQLNFFIGERFAEAVLTLVDDVGIPVEAVDLIGSHGQTIHHLPSQPEAPYIFSTLQIGEAAVIAHRTGVPTIADFRVADVAAGGQGAPLVAYVDFLMFRKRERTVALQNIGGISNVTLIPAAGDACDVLASDTGPGNMIIDAVTEIVTNRKQLFDASGRLAAQGQACESLLANWLRSPFFNAVPPKSTGREAYGRHFAQQAIEQGKVLGISSRDLVATVTEFTARTIFNHYNRFVFPHWSVDEIYVSGGGIYNVTLMTRLKNLFTPVPVEPLDSYGIPSDAKEAIAFAVLANEALYGIPANLSQVTGASQPKVLGKFVPA